MPIGCVLFLFYYLCSEFLEIILKEMRGLAIIFRFFMLLVLLLPVVALCPVKAETTSEGPISLLSLLIIPKRVVFLTTCLLLWMNTDSVAASILRS